MRGPNPRNPKEIGGDRRGPLPGVYLQAPRRHHAQDGDRPEQEATETAEGVRIEMVWKLQLACHSSRSE